MRATAEAIGLRVLDLRHIEDWEPEHVCCNKFITIGGAGSQPKILVNIH